MSIQFSDRNERFQLYQNLISASLQDSLLDHEKEEEGEIRKYPLLPLLLEPSYCEEIVKAIELDMESCYGGEDGNNGLLGNGMVESALAALGYLLSGIWIKDEVATPVPSLPSSNTNNTNTNANSNINNYNNSSNNKNNNNRETVASTSTPTTNTTTTNTAIILPTESAQSNSHPLHFLTHHESLVPRLLNLIDTALLRVKLLAIFVISNQAVPFVFNKHLSAILEAISKVLLDCEESTESGDVTFSQCLSALLTLKSQNSRTFSKHCSLQLIQQLFLGLVRFGKRMLEGCYTYSIEGIDELRGLCSILSSSETSLAKGLISQAFIALPDLSMIIKNILTRVEVRETGLELAGDMWKVWVHILSLLVSYSPASSSAQQDNLPQDIDSAKKNVANMDIAEVFKKVVVEEHGEGWGGVSKVERKLIFYDFIAPSNSVGSLVAPLQRILSCSRSKAAQCYLLLISKIVKAEQWHSPPAILKLLLRCLHHLLSLPPTISKAIASKETRISVLSENERVLLNDYLQGVHFAGEALACLLGHIHWKLQDEICKLSVSLGSAAKKRSTAGGKECVSLESLVALLRFPLDDLFPSSCADKEDAECPRKRFKKDVSLDSEDSITAVISLQAYESYVSCRSAQLDSNLRGWNIILPDSHDSRRLEEMEGGIRGLFSCKEGFRRSDILLDSSQHVQHPPIDSIARNLFSQCTLSIGSAFSMIKPSTSRVTAKCEEDLIVKLGRLWQRIVLFQTRLLLHSMVTEAKDSSTDYSSQLFSQNFSGGTNNTQHYQPYHFTQLRHSQYSASDMGNHDVARDHGSNDQIVLCAENVEMTRFVRQLFAYAIELLHLFIVDLDILVNTTKESSSSSSSCIFIGMMIESLWWILHRTSAFQFTFDYTITMDSNIVVECETFSKSRKKKKKNLEEQLREVIDYLQLCFLEIPSTMIGLLMVITICGSCCCCSKQQSCRAVQNEERILTRLFSTAIANTMNALTESGSLPQAISLIQHYIVDTYHSLPPSIHSDANNSLSLCFIYGENTKLVVTFPPVIYCIIQHFILKLAQMAAPQPSDQLSPDVLEGLIHGLRSLLTIPLCILNIGEFSSILDNLMNFKHVEDIEDDAIATGNVNSIHQSYFHLVSVWGTLESMYVSTQNTSSADGDTVSTFSNQCHQMLRILFQPSLSSSSSLDHNMLLLRCWQLGCLMEKLADLIGHYIERLNSPWLQSLRLAVVGNLIRMCYALLSVKSVSNIALLSKGRLNALIVKICKILSVLFPPGLQYGEQIFLIDESSSSLDRTPRETLLYCVTLALVEKFRRRYSVVLEIETEDRIENLLSCMLPDQVNEELQYLFGEEEEQLVDTSLDHVTVMEEHSDDVLMTTTNPEQENKKGHSLGGIEINANNNTTQMDGKEPIPGIDLVEKKPFEQIMKKTMTSPSASANGANFLSKIIHAQKESCFVYSAGETVPASLHTPDKIEEGLSVQSPVILMDLAENANTITTPSCQPSPEVQHVEPAIDMPTNGVDSDKAITACNVLTSMNDPQGAEENLEEREEIRRVLTELNETCQNMPNAPGNAGVLLKALQLSQRLSGLLTAKLQKVVEDSKE